jgi:FAD:protein FMN transferase
MTMARREFASLGGRVSIEVEDPRAEMLIDGAEKIVRQVHSNLSRFEPLSELSRLNNNPRLKVGISSLMARFLADVIEAARTSGGLVDATCLEAVENAGYRSSIDFRSRGDLPTRALTNRLPRHPASPTGTAAWADVTVNADRGFVQRPYGVRFDSGGLGKGLAADLVAEAFEDASWFAVDCAGDLRIGGTSGQTREVAVDGPGRSDGTIGALTVTGQAVATSGITRRAWIGPDGRHAHHLIDPGTGLPAFTGVIQATAVAATAVEAEVRAKAALLVGPENAAGWLEEGGVLVLDGGVVEVVTAATSTMAATATTAATSREMP